MHEVLHEDHTPAHDGDEGGSADLDVTLLEHCQRENLNPVVPRVMCVLRPLKVVIDNYPEGQTEEMTAPLFPQDPSRDGERKLPFSRVLYIERDDFAEDPPKGFHRLSPGREVRLRSAYLVRCESVVKDADGEVIEVHCTYDPETRGGDSPVGRKVKATLHWVSAPHAIDAEVRLYDRLFVHEDPASTEHFLDHLNPSSLEVLRAAKVEPSLSGAPAGSRFQFERLGYFAVDPDSTQGTLVFNRTVSLRDTWARISQKGR